MYTTDYFTVVKRDTDFGLILLASLEKSISVVPWSDFKSSKFDLGDTFSDIWREAEPSTLIK